MTFESILINFVLPLLTISMVLIFVRLFRGPSIIDKVIALDLLVIVGIAIVSVYAVLFDQPMIIDISLILALIAFLSTIAFAFYYEKRNKAIK